MVIQCYRRKVVTWTEPGLQAGWRLFCVTSGFAVLTLFVLEHTQNGNIVWENQD